MRRPHLASLAVLPLAFAALTAPAAAQDDWRPADGDRSIAFSLPSGGSTTLSYWWHRLDTARGIELDLSGSGDIQSSDDGLDRRSYTVALAMGPAFKWYRAPTGPVSPYLYGGLGVRGRWGRTEYTEPTAFERTSWGLGGYGRLGLGVDWFPLRRVSIGGYAGMRASYDFINSSERNVDVSTDGPSRHAFAADLFTSGLTLHIYF
jgi:hypothetical protein